MENRFDYNSPEEQQGWGAYATPPPTFGQHAQPAAGQQSAQQSVGQTSSLCVRVREMLPHLIENDGEVQPEMARQVYGHLSVCPGCAREFEDMRRVVTLLETLKQAEMPVDLSSAIMRRIQMQEPARPEMRHIPFSEPAAVGSAAVADASRLRPLQPAYGTLDHLSQQRSGFQQNLSETAPGLQRFTTAAILTAVLAFFLATPWGRQALNTDLASAKTWLEQIGATLEQVPLLGPLAAYIFGALAQMADALGDAYRSVGSEAVKGLALDIAVLAAAWYFLSARKARGRAYGPREGSS